MAKLKVMTILGTRPEIIRLSECIKACDRHFDHSLVHTGQNWDYTLNEVFFKDLGLRAPDHYLDCAGFDLGETMGNVISKSYKILQEQKPDALLILGDTNSALCAISAKRLKIPIFHMEAGNRCFDQNVPEEINRKIVDHISDVNMPYTEHGRRNLLAEGLPMQYIFVTGSPMREILEVHKGNIDDSSVLNELELDSRKFILLSAHREENVDKEQSLKSLADAINTTAETYNIPIIFSAHPRSKQRIEKKQVKLHKLVRSLQPFGYFDYIKLQQNAFCVLSDSGTLSEESAILSFPAVLIRTSTERPEAVDAGTITIGGITKETIIPAIDLAIGRNQSSLKKLRPPTDYKPSNVSEKVVNIIQSYTSIVNEQIWRK